MCPDLLVTSQETSAQLHEVCVLLEEQNNEHLRIWRFGADGMSLLSFRPKTPNT